jgi:hypothetical protein
MSWSIQTWGGTGWGATGTLDNPWDDEPVHTTTDKVSQLANGKKGRVTCSQRSWYSMRIFWDMKLDAMYSTWRGYLTAGTILRIWDHNANEFIGKVDSVSRSPKLVNGVVGNALTVTLNQVDDPA